MNSLLHWMTAGRWPAAALLTAIALAAPTLRAQTPEYSYEIRLLTLNDEFFERLDAQATPRLRLAPVNPFKPSERDKAAARRRLKELWDEIRKRMKESSGGDISTAAIVMPVPKKPADPPKKKPPPPPELDDDWVKDLIEKLRKHPVRIKKGGDIKLTPLPPPRDGPYSPSGGTTLPGTQPGAERGERYDPGGGGVPTGTPVLHERPEGTPVLTKIPYVSHLFRNAGIGREAQSLILIINPRIIIEGDDGSSDGSTHAGETTTPPPVPQNDPLSAAAPVDEATVQEAALFRGGESEWFATLGGGAQLASFEMELKPAPLIGQLGKLPASATRLGFSGSNGWSLQPPNQRPITRVRAEDGSFIIDPRSDFERSRGQYAAFLNALRQNNGLRGFEGDAIRNFALRQNLSLSSRQFGFDEESFQGSVMLGYRQGCCSFPDDAGQVYWQAGVAFSWMDEVNLSTPFVPTWSNDITVNYNRALNRQRPVLADRLQPISRIGLVGYQAAELEMDAQSLALFFGAGCKLPCGCRLALSLMAGWTFQQWELTERQRVTANGKRVLDAERRSSGEEAIPTLSAILEAAYPVAENIEIVLYGGTALSMGSGRKIDTDTIRFGYEGGALASRFVGLGMSVRF